MRFAANCPGSKRVVSTGTSTPAITWRQISAEEIEECLAIDPASMGHELVGYDRALAAWRKLLSHPAFVHAAIEAERAGGRRSIVGFGSAVFVTAAFAEHEVQAPNPGLNARIITSVHLRRPLVLNESSIRRANSGAGLELVILSPAANRSLLPPEAGSCINAAMARAFFQSIDGYRLRRILREAASRDAVESLRSQQMWKITRFDQDRALGVADRASTTAVPGSLGSMLFYYREPVFRFRPADQHLLIAALGGLTDEDLARTLRLTVAAIKKRWTSVFSRVAAVSPELLPEPDKSPDCVTRGPQKRHRLLAHLREHPEELRPLVR